MDYYLISLGGFTAGIFAGMLINSYLYRRYIHLKADDTSPICVDGKFYSIISEKTRVL